MGWHKIEHALERTSHQSALFGKYYIIAWLVVRMTMVLNFTTSTFKKEDKYFKCDTKVMGCSTMCFNKFSPVSMPRYWMLQLIASAVPPIVFVIYANYTLDQVQDYIKKRKRIRERQKTDIAKLQQWKPGVQINIDVPSDEDDMGEVKDDDIKDVYTKVKYDERGNNTNVPFGLTKEAPGKIVTAYFWSLVMKLAVEVAFTVGQYYIYPYHFIMSEVYDCVDVYPCTMSYNLNAQNVVQCWPSRPVEKTLFICTWYGTTLLQIILGLVELNELGMGRVCSSYSTHQDITKEFR